MKRLYEYLGFGKQDEYDVYLDSLPNSLVRKLTILENKLDELGRDLIELEKDGYRRFYPIKNERFFGYDDYKEYWDFLDQLKEEHPDLFNRIGKVEQLLSDISLDLIKKNNAAFLEEADKITLGNHILYKSKISGVESQTITIPQGNDNYVDETKIVVLVVASADGTYIIYESDSRAGDLINNMINNAMLGKRKFENRQVIKGGLEIFQNYYNKFYSKYTWIGVKSSLKEALNLFY